MGAVGVEHIHTIYAVVVAYKEQYAVAADASLTVADAACKVAEVDAVKLLSGGIHHYKVVARAVAFDNLDSAHCGCVCG